MKLTHQVVAAIVAVPLAIAIFQAVSQTTTVGGDLVLIAVDAGGNEMSRTDGSYITFDYGNGTPRKLVVTKLADTLFTNGFDDPSARQEQVEP